MLAFCAPVGTNAGEWGHLTGRFVYGGTPPTLAPLPTAGLDRRTCGDAVPNESLVIDPKARGLANIVIYLRTEGMPVHSSYGPAANGTVVLTHRSCRLVPHITLLRTTQTLRTTNNDPIPHNTNMSPPLEYSICPILPPADSLRRFQKRQAAPFEVMCNIHPWEKGYVLVRDNPYMAITATDGTFWIKNLPVGTLEFQFWHERTGHLVAKPNWTKGRLTQAIAGGKTVDLGIIQLAPLLFD
jgi:hypothetical protein